MWCVLLFTAAAQTGGALILLNAVLTIGGFASTVRSLDEAGDFLPLTLVSLFVSRSFPLLALGLVAIGHALPLIAMGLRRRRTALEAIATQALCTGVEVALALFGWLAVLTDLLAQTHRAGC
ncbi:MAG: hypothetical protein U0234_26285 [Sandaracinus sp.]